ncbi:MAG TPA: serine hydrolase domain-containing protein [Gemmatimonadaceae bacterium]|nr:serine hydrolase domain-containing protein [Gemmatimonadaceae bacterium]
MVFRLPRITRTLLARAIAALVVTTVVAGCARQPIVVPPAPEPAAPIPPPPPRLPAVGALVPAPPASVGMDSTLPARLDSIIQVGLAEGAAPGAAVAVGRYGRLVFTKGYGTLDYAPDASAVTPRSIYDLASLTKVVATTTSAMILEEAGKLDIDKPVAFYVPELNAPDKAAITVRMLLTHSGGLEAYAPLYNAANGSLRGRAEYLAAINERPLQYPPGTQTVYSDWDMVLMQAVIERITGMSLDQYADGHVFRQLGMTDTRFRPDTSDRALRARIAPTTQDSLRGGRLRGTVHDANAWALGGVSGHAGLFSTAHDLAIFAQFLLDGGTFDRVRILAPQTIARWTARQNGIGSRTLGWDTPSPGSSAGRYFSPRSFGHTGFTGTSLWIDPEKGVFVVLLMNRVTLRGEATRHAQLRRDVADEVQRAVLDAPLIDWESLR